MKSRTVLGLCATAAAAFALTACGGGGKTSNGNNKTTTGTRVKEMNPMHAAHNAISGHLLNVNMGAMNGSKQDGAASMGDEKNGVRVLIHLYNEPSGASEPAHIHQGSCKKLNPAPWKPLKNVVNGTSNTFVSGVTIGEIKKGTYAINVHKSANDLKTYVSCGDLKP